MQSLSQDLLRVIVDFMVLPATTGLRAISPISNSQFLRDEKGTLMDMLKDLLVIDITSAIVGPACTLRFAELGAEVIKIEPLTGDIMRQLGGASPSGEDSPTYIQFNKGKRSVTLDLTSDAGKDAIRRLITDADVFVSNLRPAALSKLGLDGPSVRALNGKIIYCQITGFATGGPYDGLPAYDSIVQAGCGIAGLFMDRDGAPKYVPSVVCDHVVGEIAFGAIMSALYRRAVSGEAVQLEVPMFEYMSAYLLKEHLGQRTFGNEAALMGDPRLLDANTAPIETRDGWISVTVNTDKQFRSFVAGAGRDDLIDDVRFATLRARIENLQGWLELRNGIFAAKTTREWLTICRENDIPAMPCNSLSELVGDPQLETSKLLQMRDHETLGPVMTVCSPLRVNGEMVDRTSAASGLGADTVDVLKSLGMS